MRPASEQHETSITIEGSSWSQRARMVSFSTGLRAGSSWGRPAPLAPEELLERLGKLCLSASHWKKLATAQPPKYRKKWEYRIRYAYYLISAAELIRVLRTNCAHPEPEHESQVRPLIGLTSTEAQLAWNKAVELAGQGRITARFEGRRLVTARRTRTIRSVQKHWRASA